MTRFLKQGNFRLCNPNLTLIYYMNNNLIEISKRTLKINKDKNIKKNIILINKKK